jgi:hypothetical protein
VQPSLFITGPVNTTADTLLDAKDKIFVRVITAQAPNKKVGFFRLSCHGMLPTPLAFDCSANEMSSALLELPSFVANITVCSGSLAKRPLLFQFFDFLTSRNVTVNEYATVVLGISFSGSQQRHLRVGGLHRASSHCNTVL